MESINTEEKQYKILCEKVRNIYGEKAEKIIRERPELSNEDIPTFDIFDEEIMNLIGYGGVNAFLTYSMSSTHVITEMVKKRELIEYYKAFLKMTGKYFPNSAIGLDDRLNAFYEHRGLVEEIVHNGKQEELKENLLLMLRDEEYKLDTTLAFFKMDGRDEKAREIKEGLKVSSIEDLMKYDATRKEILSREISNPQLHFDQVKELLKMKYFGAIKNLPGQYNKYDHKKFLKDYLKFNSVELSEDEVDLIELYSMIEETNDTDILRKLNTMLDERKETIDPVHMKEIDEKVVRNYKKEYVDSLLTVDEIKKMASDPQSKTKLTAIYKKNGDYVTPNYVLKADGTELYPDHKVLPDGEKIYEDHIEKSDGTCVYRYDTQNPDFSPITKSSKGNNTKIEYEFNGKKISAELSDGNITGLEYPFERKTSTGIQEGKLIVEKADSEYGDYSYKYILYSEDKNKCYEGQWYGRSDENNITCPINYRQIDMQTGKEIYKKKLFRVSRYQSVEENLFFNNVHDFEIKIEDDFKKYIEKLKKVKASPQFDKSEFEEQAIMEIEDGDVGCYDAYDIDPRKLCATIIRDGVTSEELRKKNLFSGKIEKNGFQNDFCGDTQDRIYIEKYLEGGIATRSFYYRYNNSIGIGFAMTSIDPDSIIGYNEYDDDTSHTLKDLRPSMNVGYISNILDGKKTSVSAELAMLRYEYDLGKIQERHNRWES